MADMDRLKGKAQKDFAAAAAAHFKEKHKEAQSGEKGEGVREQSRADGPTPPINAVPDAGRTIRTKPPRGPSR